MIMKIFAALAIATSLSGCIAALAAPSLLAGGGTVTGVNSYAKHVMSKAERQQATAEAINHDLNPRMMKMSGAQTDGFSVRWTADIPEGRYLCTQI